MRTGEDPWSPYQPVRDDPWDLGKVAHLHRRAGFGATRAELARDLEAGPTASVGRLLDPPGPSSQERERLDWLRAGVENSAGTEARVERLKAYWLYRIIYGPDPLREKLTLFWHGLFATSNRKVQNVDRMLAQNELFRRSALGDFRELAAATLVDPAMLVWLDGVGNPKERPNENLAREFLELFTLGVGHYTEADVREAARALTGWVKDGEEGDYGAAIRFDVARFDGGSKTFLGRTGPWKPADIARIALEQPAAAEHLAGKLYRFFVRDDVEPGPDLIRPLADRIRARGFSVREAMGMVLRSRHFYAAGVRRHLIKGPVEFTAGLVRMLEVPRGRLDLTTVSLLCDRQGQSLFHPPNVKGWDGGRSWVSSATLLARSNATSDLVWGDRSMSIPAFDPESWASGNRVTAGDVARGLADLLLQGDLAPEARSMAFQVGGDGTADGSRKSLQILLSCPEFQLA
jgi:uncharacterized protein (DUF1800 family)